MPGGFESYFEETSPLSIPDDMEQVMKICKALRHLVLTLIKLPRTDRHCRLQTYMLFECSEIAIIMQEIQTRSQCTESRSEHRLSLER